jgi:cation transport regulator ChaB
MPYSKNEDLPARVKDNLPSEAQRVWREIFNNAYEQYKDDSRAAATAWAGLERSGWSKGEGGKWTKQAKKSVGNGPFNLFVPITKIDIEKRLVYGTAADETPDHADEIFDYNSSKPYFEEWSNNIEKSTDGKSKGNIRGMHGKIAAGKVQDIRYNDNSKSIPVCAKVIDDNEWEKCKEGVYTGFSIGGQYLKRWFDSKLNKTRYTAKPSEISLVDLPCNPSATFQMVKADGMVEERCFKTQFEAAEFQINEVADAYDEFESNPFKQVGYKILETYLEQNKFVLESDPDFDGSFKFYEVFFTHDNGEFNFSQPEEMIREFKPKGEEGVEEVKKVSQREDVSEADKERAKGKYGDVTYADEKNKKYPLDTEEHVRAAASYWGMPKNKEKYSSEDQKKISAAIERAKSKFGIGDKAEKGVNTMDELEKKHDDSKEDPKHEATESKEKEKKEQEDPEYEAQDDKKIKKEEKGEKEEDEKEKSEKAFGEGDLIKSFEGLLNLAKVGASHSKNTLEKLRKISHDIAEMGGACKCDKCQKIYRGEDGVKKSVEDQDLQKSVQPEMINKPENSELQKMIGRFDALEKTLNGLKAENEALSKTVQDLRDQPMPGGAILNGQAVVEKKIGASPAATINPDEGIMLGLEKALEVTKSPAERERISAALADIEMKKALQEPIFRK